MFSKTGSTDLRLTDVQQPKTTATLSWSSSCLAFSAKRSQFDAGSTTTGWIGRPITPPLALISSTAISTTSRSDTSLMAIVPDSECRTPILTGSLLWAAMIDGKPCATAAPAPAATRPVLRKSLRE